MASPVGQGRPIDPFESYIEGGAVHPSGGVLNSYVRAVLSELVELDSAVLMQNQHLAYTALGIERKLLVGLVVR